MRLCLALVLSLAACGGGSSHPDAASGADGPAADAPPAIDAMPPDAMGPDAGLPPDMAAPLFDPAHVVEVSITLADADWQTLRSQSRSIPDTIDGDCLAQPFPNPFTWFDAQATIDGMAFPVVRVKKKGFLGSGSYDKPALKVKLDTFIGAPLLYGLKELVLNNAVQDPSYVRTCLAYEIFTAAGVPSPRCNFAHVTVNGVNMGLYVNVENQDKLYLSHHFASYTGNLYKGILSDFRPTWQGTFQKETNKSDPSTADLDALTTALAAGNGTLVAGLVPIVDLDHFLTFWAVESLLRHWDGYAGNTNNFFVYHDPSTGKFEFLPWGPDQVMQNGGDAIVSAYGMGQLAYRLYAIQAIRDLYDSRMTMLLGSVWNETSILAEIDRMQALITPIADPDGSQGLAAQLDDVRNFVNARRAPIEAELAGPPPSFGPPRDTFCLTDFGHVTGTFSTTWGTLNAPNPWAAGTGTLTADLNGMPIVTTAIGATAGPDPNAMGGPANAIIEQVLLLPDGSADVIVLSIAPASFTPATTLADDWMVVNGQLLHFDPPAMTVTKLAQLGKGTVTLDMVSTIDGMQVTGSFDTTLTNLPW